MTPAITEPRRRRAAPEARSESRLLLAASPALYALLTAGRFIGPVRRLPRLGWVVSDPSITRRLLSEPEHASLIGEGGVGHLWSQLLGDWVEEVFDVPGHVELRARGKDLFTDDSARAHVERVFHAPAAALAAQLARGETVDIAQTARAWVGRMVADLLGLPESEGADDAAFRRIFAQGERLAALARDTIGSTVVAPRIIEEGRAIVMALTAGVPRAYELAGTHTLLGRCREAGIPAQVAQGLASVLLVAGTETAASAMTRGVALLHDTGQQHWLLRDPSHMRGAVREILRVTTPAPLIGRHISADITLAGKTLRRGERVLMLVYVANNAAGRFDIRRPADPSVYQLWFGAGRHICLGAPLARAEITYLLHTLTAGGRPWQIVQRRAARHVVVPSYQHLLIRYAPAGTPAPAAVFAAEPDHA